MLTDHDVFVLHTAQSIAVGLSWRARASRPRPRRGRYLHEEALPGVVPGEDSFRMTPGSTAFLLAVVYDRIVVKLIVPNDIVKGAVIDLIECCSDRFGRGVTRAATSLLQR